MTCGCIDCRKPCCRRNLLGEDGEDQAEGHLNYSSGESDTEFATPFNDLSTQEKKTRIFFLWGKAFSRSRGACLIIRKNLFQQEKIKMFGTIKEKKQEERLEDQLLKVKKAKCIIMPQNKHLMRWSIWISVLLIWTALSVPVKVSFNESDKTPLPEIIFDTCIDCCFLIDIVLTFFSAIERKDGVYEVSHKVLAA